MTGPTRWISTICLALAVLGCTRPSPTAPVTGRITVAGRPLSQGRVQFHPDSGRMAHGDIASDGTFSLTTFVPSDGALPGRHRVVVEATVVHGPPPPKSLADELDSGRTPPTHPPEVSVEWLAPERYSRLETTPLVAEVRETDNHFDFDLPAEPSGSRSR